MFYIWIGFVFFLCTYFYLAKIGKYFIEMFKNDNIPEFLKNQILKSFIRRIVFNRKECTVKIYYYV